MSKIHQHPLLVTQGDPAGIGPEITAKTWDFFRSDKRHVFALVANPNTINTALKMADLPPAKEITYPAQAHEFFEKNLPLIPLEQGTPAKAGHPDIIHAKSVITSIETSVGLCLAGEAAGVVTNPIAKNILYQAGFKFPGHTEFLGELTQHSPSPYVHGPVMMLSGGGLHVALVTIHTPISAVPSTISQPRIVERAKILDAALRIDLGVANPRIALCGLNPHAGENGSIGREELDIINPAAEALRREGVNITDACSADTLFHAEARETYDGVLAMYHDQGLIPVKTLDFHGGVNTTLGLPIIRTSPDHGTAFNIAGQGCARPDSLIAAIKLARIMAKNRTKNTHG